MSIKDRTKRIILGGAAAVGLTLGVAALSGAATTPAPQPSAPAQDQAAEQDEAQDPNLNGSIQSPEDESASEADETKALEGLAKISAADAEKAALAAVPGGTVNASALENENGSVVYKVDMTDANGTALEVKVDAGNAKVLDQSADDEATEGPEGPEANESAETGAPEVTPTR